MEGTCALGRSGHERPVSGEPAQARAVERSLRAGRRAPGSSPAGGLRPQLLLHRELHRRSPSIPCTQSVDEESLARRAPGYFGSFRIHATIASTTAAGCSGMRAWLASGITAIVTRPPSSSLSSFVVSRGLKGSSAAWRSSKGALPAPHHSSCRVARPAANWLAFTSGYQPSSHTLASWPGAMNVARRYFRRSSSGSVASALLVTASASALG